MDRMEANNSVRLCGVMAAGPIFSHSSRGLNFYLFPLTVERLSGNTDTLNVKRYRNAKADGKWRWVLFDLDWAFSVDTNSVSRWLTPGGMGNGNRTNIVGNYEFTSGTLALSMLSLVEKNFTIEPGSSLLFPGDITVKIVADATTTERTLPRPYLRDPFLPLQLT